MIKKAATKFSIALQTKPWHTLSLPSHAFKNTIVWRKWWRKIFQQILENANTLNALTNRAGRDCNFGSNYFQLIVFCTKRNGKISILNILRKHVYSKIHAESKRVAIIPDSLAPSPFIFSTGKYTLKILDGIFSEFIRSVFNVILKLN